VLQVVDQRPDGPAEVDRAVLVEAGVLDPTMACRIGWEIRL